MSMGTLEPSRRQSSIGIVLKCAKLEERRGRSMWGIVWAAICGEEGSHSKMCSGRTRMWRLIRSTGTPSLASSAIFRSICGPSVSPQNPPMLPPVFTHRWQGTVGATGFRLRACPTLCMEMATARS